MRLTIERLPIMYELLYRPESYFLARRLIGPEPGRLEDVEKEVAQAYGNSLNFAFTTRANTETMDRQSLAAFTLFQNQWVVNPTVFYTDALIATPQGDTLKCVVAEPRIERMNGLYATVMLGFASPDGEKPLKKGKLIIRNHGFWTETLEFDLGNIRPKLRFAPTER